MFISMTPQAILNFMRKYDYTAEIQEDTQQVYTILSVKEKEYPLFLRVFDDGHLLQLIVFIPSALEPNERFAKENAETISEAVPSSTDPAKQHQIINDVSRLLHILNKELDMPGFGMDEMAGVVFYRLMLPTPNKKIDEELLLAFIKATEHVCEMFTIPIEAVCAGQMTLDEILSKAQGIENE